MPILCVVYCQAVKFDLSSLKTQKPLSNKKTVTCRRLLGRMECIYLKLYPRGFIFLRFIHLLADIGTSNVEYFARVGGVPCDAQC